MCGNVNALPVSPTLSNQPAKVYPVLVLVAVVENCSAVLVEVALTAVPPLGSKVTARVLASHFA